MDELEYWLRLKIAAKQSNVPIECFYLFNRMEKFYKPESTEPRVRAYTSMLHNIDVVGGDLGLKYAGMYMEAISIAMTDADPYFSPIKHDLIKLEGEITKEQNQLQRFADIIGCSVDEIEVRRPEIAGSVAAIRRLMNVYQSNLRKLLDLGTHNGIPLAKRMLEMTQQTEDPSIFEVIEAQVEHYFADPDNRARLIVFFCLK